MSILNELHTAVPAEIVEFEPKTCTATVQPKAKMILSNGKEMDYPLVNDVPVLFQQGAGQDVVVVFPVKKGDGCLLVISEQALDSWREEGEQFSEMKYALSNAVAIPGLFKKPTSDVKDAVSDNCVIIRNKNTKIAISKKKIAIDGDIEVKGSIKATGNISENNILMNPFWGL